MALLGVQNYDECVRCNEVCSKCWKEDKHLDFTPIYPLSVQSHQETVPNTFKRWAQRHVNRIRSFVRQHFAREDWDAQTEWMVKHPHVAYHQMNNSLKQNNVKIAKIVSWLWSMDYGVIPVVGGQQQGKTMTMLFLAEIMHDIKPNKPIVYFTKNKGQKHPKWMMLCDNLNEVPNGAMLTIDEGGLRAFAGDHQKTQQKWLVKLSAIVGHKRLIVLLATQSLHIMGVNLIRLLTAMIAKPISDVAKAFGERDLIDKLLGQIPTDPTETTIWNPRPPDKFIISFWQPMPRFDGHEEFKAAFAEHDVTKEESLFTVQALKKLKIILKCSVCGHRWPQRSEFPPAMCPKCQSRKWDTGEISIEREDKGISNYEQARAKIAAR